MKTLLITSHVDTQVLHVNASGYPIKRKEKSFLLKILTILSNAKKRGFRKVTPFILHIIE